MAAATLAPPPTAAGSIAAGGPAPGAGAGELLRVRVETPENILLELPLAGLTRRAGAWAIDTAIRVALVAGAVFLVIPLAIAGLGGTGTGLFLLALFLTEWGYFTLCEAYFGGRTPGKRAAGLKVVRTDGGPVTFWPALVRNLLRFADGLPILLSPAPHVLGAAPLYGLGAASVVLSPRGSGSATCSPGPSWCGPTRPSPPASRSSWRKSPRWTGP